MLLLLWNQTLPEKLWIYFIQFDLMWNWAGGKLIKSKWEKKLEMKLKLLTFCRVSFLVEYILSSFPPSWDRFVSHHYQLTIFTESQKININMYVDFVLLMINSNTTVELHSKSSCNKLLFIWSSIFTVGDIAIGRGICLLLGDVNLLKILLRSTIALGRICRIYFIKQPKVA